MSSYLYIEEPETRAFFDAAGRSNFTFNEQYAVNYIVANFKAAGVWNKCRAIYPFVGGTASTHRWNLKDPRDLDAAFRLTFPNGMTHSSLGIQGNRTNQYANTFLTPSSSLVVNNTHLSVYVNQSSTNNGVDIGCADGLGGSSDNRMGLISFFSNLSITDQYSFTGGGRVTTSPLGKGYYLSSRISNTNLSLYQNSILRATNTSSLSLLSLPTTRPLTILAESRQNSGIVNYSDRRLSLATIGDGLTDTEAIAMSNTVYFTQRILNRA
jgi:hypothetical protein